VSRVLRVVRSPIHGYGVVARRAFRAGQRLANIEGIAWLGSEGRDDTYSLIVAPGLFFDMVDETRWVNHSCDPNASVKSGLGAGGLVWARLVAKREIQEGEEIAFDYAYPLELAVPCKCGSAKCRGMIVDELALAVVA
jgi:uncharacterized protein